MILGSSLGSSTTIDLSNADYSFIGESSKWITSTVAAAGDVDGDGLGDILIGAPGIGPIGTAHGRAYLILGSSLGTDSTIELSQADYIFLGEEDTDKAGRVVSSAGDVDNDGLSDILISATTNDDGGSAAGKVYLILGSSLGSGTNIDLSNADYSFIGEDSYDYARMDITSGNVDGDEFDDILIAASNHDSNVSPFGPDYLDELGKGYIILGSSLGSNSTIDLSDADYSFVGEYEEDALDHISIAGDVDNDGLDDILMGAPGNDEAGDR